MLVLFRYDVGYAGLTYLLIVVDGDHIPSGQTGKVSQCVFQSADTYSQGNMAKHIPSI